ncbi:MAG: Holliday junction resolvase RuvX [bacterium]|nr:Holliday junction resolvase RuvX [bacterium]
MSILGIDYGKRKIGLAKAAAGTPAVPLAIWENRGQRGLLARISALCQDEGIEEIVVGLPVSIGGFAGSSAAAIKLFAQELAATTRLPVHVTDERLSTKMAQRLQRGMRGQDDATAAMLILQSWLDSKLQT